MEKNNALAKCRLGLRAWRAKKPLLCLHAVTDEDGHPPENENESGRKLCEYWCAIFQACVEGQRHHHYENILWYVQKAPDDILWVIEKKTSLTNSWPQRRNLLLVLIEFRTAFAGVRYNHVWVVLSVRYLPKVERLQQQWKNCEIIGGPTSADAVQLRLQDSSYGRRFPMDQPSWKPCSEAAGPCPTVVIISLRPYHT